MSRLLYRLSYVAVMEGTLSDRVEIVKGSTSFFCLLDKQAQDTVKYVRQSAANGMAPGGSLGLPSHVGVLMPSRCQPYI